MKTMFQSTELLLLANPGLEWRACPVELADVEMTSEVLSNSSILTEEASVQLLRFQWVLQLT